MTDALPPIYGDANDNFKKFLLAAYHCCQVTLFLFVQVSIVLDGFPNV